MPYIVVATNFSHAAENAANYACQLAVDTFSDIVLLHSYTIPIVFSDTPTVAPVNEILADAEEQLTNTLKKLTAAYPQVNFDKIIAYGNIIDAIEEYSEKKGDPKLVVLGNSYNPNNPAWIDSTLVDTFRNLNVPVLAVPSEYDYEKINKIGLAYDNIFEGSSIALVQLRELTEWINTELHVFYAQPEDTEATGINEQAKNVLQSANPLYHIYKRENTDLAIYEFAATYNIGWLVLIPRKHSFFERIFKKSHTEKAVNNGYMPILAIHEQK